MEFQCVFLLLILSVKGNGRVQFCPQLVYCKADEVRVCGVRLEQGGVRFRLFDNECELLRYGCGVPDNMTYGTLSLDYCTDSFSFNSENNSQVVIEDSCKECDIKHTTGENDVCGIIQDGKGFKIRLFQNNCHMDSFNCKNNVEFVATDYFICNGLNVTEYDKQELNKSEDKLTQIDNLLSTFRKNNKIPNGSFENNVVINNFIENNQAIGSLIRKKYGNFSIKTYDNANEDVNNNTLIDDESANIDRSIDESIENGAVNNSHVENSNLNEYVDEKPTVQAVIKNYSKDTEIPNIKLPRNRNKKEVNVSKNGFQGKQRSNDSDILVVVDSSVFKPKNDINESIANFFAATHVLDLPLTTVDDIKDENGRRATWIKLAKPHIVYKPWRYIPKNITDDYDHQPTLNTCYHKCPKKCPEIYAPVCGTPGVSTMEPSIMFRNHCLMDVAHCKMWREQKSSTARSSTYRAASFLFCLGEEINAAFRFLPLVKTLQRMGRLKKKSHYNYRIRNMKFFNNHMKHDPKIIG